MSYRALLIKSLGSRVCELFCVFSGVLWKGVEKGEKHVTWETFKKDSQWPRKIHVINEYIWNLSVSDTFWIFNNHYFLFSSAGLKTGKNQNKRKKPQIPNFKSKSVCSKMLQNHNFLCLFPRLWPITPNQLSVFTGCLGETSSNNDSGEFSLLLYHPALCAGKRTMWANGRGQRTLSNLSLLV